MKAAETKPSAKPASKSTPFFSKESGAGFFGSKGPDSAFFSNSFSHTTVQPKLTIGQPNDKYEQEADTMADKVVQRLSQPETVQAKPLESGISPFIQTKCTACEQEEKKQNNEEAEEEKLKVKKLQRKSVSEGNDELLENEKTIQRKCAACDEEEKLQAKADTNFLTAGPAIESGLAASKSSGNPLPATTLTQMESSFGADFSNVRIHHDSAAMQMNRSLQALAFTNGNDIYFNSGKYDPSSQTGKHLLAHELTHTIQQGGSGVKRKPTTVINSDPEPKLQRQEEEERLGKDAEMPAMSASGSGSDPFEEDEEVQTKSERSATESLALNGSHLLGQEAHQAQIRKATLSVSSKAGSVPGIQCVVPLIGIGVGLLGRYLVGKGIRWGIRKLFEEDESKSLVVVFEELRRKMRAIPVNIRGMGTFTPPLFVKDYIQSYYYTADFLQESGYSAELVDLFNQGPQINFRYGNMGKVNGVYVKWDAKTDKYQAGPFQMGMVHPDFDFFSQGKRTLGMNVRITDSIITGEVGVAPLGAFFHQLAISTQHGKPENFVFDTAYLQEALLDKDAENATPIYSEGTLSGGYIDLVYTGWADIGNFQSITAAYLLRDSQNKSDWSAHTELDVMGMKPFNLNILRTAKGILSGIMADGEKILFASSIEEKGFKASTEIKASYLNQTLMIQGTGSFKTKRAKGDLFFIVTDYTTAKNRAHNFFANLQASGPLEEGPENPTERLAFMASGNLTIILFEGNSEDSRTKQIAKKLKGIVLDEPSPGKKAVPPLEANASFVVEPEGYITVFGQIKPVQDIYDLTARQEYKQATDIIPGGIPLGMVPLPYGFGVGFKFTAEAFAEAYLGPLQLSQIFANGFFSTNPRFATELNLGAKLRVEAGIKAGIRFCLEISAEALGGLISITVIEKCIEGAVGMTGAVQAEPSIQIRKAAATDKDKVPEYFIKGDLHLSAGVGLAAKLADTLSIKVEDIEDEENKGVKPLKTWYYKNNERIKEKKYGDKSVVAPVDLTLGSGDPPPVSVPAFTKDGTWVILNSLLDRDKKVENYFDEKESTAPAPDKPKGPGQPDDTKFEDAGFEESGKEKGGLSKEPEKKKDEETVYTFEHAFKMLSNVHKLVLQVKQTRKGDEVQAISKLLMHSETEPLTEKIKEEKDEVTNSTEPNKPIRQEDLKVIENQAALVVADANQLGINEQLNNQTQVGGLKETAESITQYGDRYQENDLGVQEQIPKPNCDKPKLEAKDEVTFAKRDDQNTQGWVIEVFENPVVNQSGQTTGNEWYIRFYPLGKPETQSLINPAYEAGCNPLFVKYVAPVPDPAKTPKPGEPVLTFDQRLQEILKLNPQPKVPPLLPNMIEKLRMRKVSDDAILAIIQNAFTHHDVSATLTIAYVHMTAGKAVDVLGKPAFDILITGLSGGSAFVSARFLAKRIFDSQAPKIKVILSVFTLEETGSLRLKFPAAEEIDFTDSLVIIAKGTEGTTKDIFTLLDEAGKGEAALSNLTGAVLRLGVGKHTPDDIRESLAHAERVKKAMGDPKQREAQVQAIFGKAYNGKTNEHGQFEVAEGIKKTGMLPVAFIGKGISGIVNNLINGGETGTSIDEEKWDIFRRVIRKTDLLVVEKNGIIGKVWGAANLKIDENVNGKANVQEEVSMRWLEKDGTWSKDWGRVDAVIMKGIDPTYREYKSSETASTSGAQAIIYNLLENNKLAELKPFGANAEKIFGGKDMPLFKTGPVEFARAKNLPDDQEGE